MTFKPSLCISRGLQQGRRRGALCVYRICYIKKERKKEEKRKGGKVSPERSEERYYSLFVLKNKVY